MPNKVTGGKHMDCKYDPPSSIQLALAGNPNSGKTTLFNTLTGARQHVGNYPGVTVEKVEGICSFGKTQFNIVDLPGTYSLSAYSIEERVARKCIVQDTPDVVVDVVDASNLERNLYLAVQIMELDVPVVLAMNMSDVAKQRGIQFDIPLLEKLLGVTIVPTIAHKGMGKDALLKAVLNTASQSKNDSSHNLPRVSYGDDIEKEIKELVAFINKNNVTYYNAPSRWLAIKLLESDTELHEQIDHPQLFALADKSIQRIESITGDRPDAIIADKRYGWINGACQEAVRSTVESRRTVSERIDSVVTHRLLGLPIFLGLMYLVFQLTFTAGTPPMDWIDAGFGALGEWVSSFWAPESNSLLQSLIVDGIIGGVGGVLIFLPNIVLLFLAIAILEDSGYMARAAFLMDRLMHKIGLHGKSFIPMLIGFGCSIPAIMATRTLENRKDRMITMLVVPLMSCGARLPIYALLIPAFFPKQWHGLVLWSLYTIGIVLAILCAKLLRKTLFRGEAPPFVMELPPYRMPTAKGICVHLWNRGGAYLKKAGTVILGISVLLWAMQQWPGIPNDKAQSLEAQRTEISSRLDLSEELRQEQLSTIDHDEAELALESSLMGQVGKGLEPILKPCGFDWKLSTAMIGAFAAKEVFVAQMGIIYSLGEDEDEESEPLIAKLQANYTPLQGFCIMLFCLISAPCMATIAITKRESNSWKWAMFQLIGLTVLAWIVTMAVYQIGLLFI
jgi:ferrous iron transport protein B